MSDLNDPRVFFAAERTLLAWTRTSLTLMAFGFVIERFGIYRQLFIPTLTVELKRGASFWIGILFVLLGVYAAYVSHLQFRRVLRTLKPVEIPERYSVFAGSIINLTVALLGLALTVYLYFSNP